MGNGVGARAATERCIAVNIEEMASLRGELAGDEPKIELRSSREVRKGEVSARVIVIAEVFGAKKWKNLIFG